MPAPKQTKTDEILQAAMENEQKAVDLYTELAKGGHRNAVKEMFLELAAEEKRHKILLDGVRSGRRRLPPAASVARRVSLEDESDLPDVSGPLSLKGSILFAMGREKSAFNLYIDLSDLSDDPEVKDLFLSLAREEASHKLRLERVYDML
ncbi:MAG: ferritin family protein [Elusimicrobiota bacterium]|jgi:rubrerythrin